MSKWISIKDRLPEEGGYFLVCGPHFVTWAGYEPPGGPGPTGWSTIPGDLTEYITDWTQDSSGALDELSQPNP